MTREEHIKQAYTAGKKLVRLSINSSGELSQRPVGTIEDIKTAPQVLHMSGCIVTSHMTRFPYDSLYVFGHTKIEVPGTPLGIAPTVHIYCLEDDVEHAAKFLETKYRVTLADYIARLEDEMDKVKPIYNVYAKKTAVKIPKDFTL